MFVGVGGAPEVAGPLASRNQVVAVLFGDADGFAAGFGGILPVALAVQVVQLAGRIEQCAGFHRLGRHAVGIGHVGTRQMAFGSGSGIPAHLAGGDEALVGAVEILGAPRIGLPGRQPRHVPLVVLVERLVEIGHAAEDPAQREVGVCADEIGLSEQIVLVLLFDVLHAADVLDALVADADDAEHRIGDRPSGRRSREFRGVLAHRPRLDLLAAQQAAGVAQIGELIPGVAAGVHVEIERIGTMDSRRCRVDIVVVGLEVVPYGEHLILVETHLGVDVQVVASRDAQCEGRKNGYDRFFHALFLVRILESDFYAQFDAGHHGIEARGEGGALEVALDQVGERQQVGARQIEAQVAESGALQHPFRAERVAQIDLFQTDVVGLAPRAAFEHHRRAGAGGSGP